MKLFALSMRKAQIIATALNIVGGKNNQEISGSPSGLPVKLRWEEVCIPSPMATVETPAFRPGSQPSHRPEGRGFQPESVFDEKNRLRGAFCLVSGSVTAEMNKCVAPQGKILFSDQPCPPEMAGGSINLPRETAANQESSHKQYSESDYYKRISRERRAREIDFEISAKENALRENIEKMNRETSELQALADEMGENKFNALSQQSLHLKIQAMAEKYRAENTTLNEQIASLRAEKRLLERQN